MRFCLFIALCACGCAPLEVREYHYQSAPLGAPINTSEPPKAQPIKPAQIGLDTEPPRIVGPIRVSTPEGPALAPERQS